jgi:hypothetical protein
VVAVAEAEGEPVEAGRGRGRAEYRKVYRPLHCLDEPRAGLSMKRPRELLPILDPTARTTVAGRGYTYIRPHFGTLARNPNGVKPCDLSILANLTKKVMN